MDPRIDAGLVRALGRRIDVQTLVQGAVEEWRQRREVAVTWPSILAAMIEGRDLERQLAALTLQEVVATLGSRDIATAEVGLPGDLPLVLAVRFMAVQNASTVRVKSEQEAWVCRYDLLEQTVTRLREAFARRAGRALTRSPLLEGAGAAPLALGRTTWERAVDRLAIGQLYFRCAANPKHCFPSTKLERWCVFEDGPVQQVSSC